MVVMYRGKAIELPANVVLAGWCFVTFAIAWGLNLVGLPLVGGLVALLCMILLIGLVLRVIKATAAQLFGALRRSKE